MARYFSSYSTAMAVYLQKRITRIRGHCHYSTCIRSMARAYLKIGNMSNSQGFFPWASHFLQEYWMYFKKKWCGTAKKDLLPGRIDSFQTGPRLFLRLLSFRQHYSGRSGRIFLRTDGISNCRVGHTPPTSYDNCRSKTEGPGDHNHVIASPERGVAISCCNVQIPTQYQEIATSLRSSQ